MPNPQFTKPWHGVPRGQIAWNPAFPLDTSEQLLGAAPNLRVPLVVESGAAPAVAAERLDFRHGTVLDALRDDAHLLARRGVYAAGPPAMLRELAHTLGGMGVEPGRIHIDSFGV